MINPFSPNSDQNENFSSHHHYLFKHSSDENKGMITKDKIVLILRQVLLTSSIRNEWRTVRRIAGFSRDVIKF